MFTTLIHDIRRELIDQTRDEQIRPARRIAGVFTIHDLFSIKRVGDNSEVCSLLNLGLCDDALTYELACRKPRRKCLTARRDN